jgi:hypothetical protein
MERSLVTNQGHAAVKMLGNLFLEGEGDRLV